MISNYDLFAQEAEWLGAALWIGEYGGIASDVGIAPYMDAQFDGAAGVGAGTSCIAGSLIAYEYDEANMVLTVRLTPDPEIDATTDIVVPTRVYPGGVDVECGGCTADVQAGVVRLSGAPDVVEISASQ